MDLAKIEMFVRVVECGSLSEVSLQFGLGRSALSRHLATLEADCGGRLFHRTGRGVRLTEYGERLLPRARSLLAEADALRNEIADASNVFTGKVHVASVPAIAAPVMTKVVLLARERFPNVVVHIASGLSGQVDQWIADGTVDLGFVLRANPDEAMGRPLAMSRMCLVVPAGAPIAKRASIEFTELGSVPLIQPGTFSAFQSSILETARKAGVQFRVVAEVDSIEVTKSMVAAGVGYALLSASAVVNEVRAGQLSTVDVVNPELMAYVHLVSSQRKAASLATREISRLIRQVAESLQTGHWGESVRAA